MTEIPQDIWDAADQAHYKGHRERDNRVKIDFIAEAILAERKARNAEIQELLGALKILASWCRGYEINSNNKIALDLLEQADAAIAKATGEPNGK